MSSNNHGAIPSIVSAHFGCFLPCIFRLLGQRQYGFQLCTTQKKIKHKKKKKIHKMRNNFQLSVSQ